jgi:hypothetical protein
MSGLRSRLRSELKNLNETNKVLAKIEFLLSQKSTRVVFEKGGFRINASLCTNVIVDYDLASGQIQYQPPGAGAPQIYNTSDIIMIRRVRTKKYVIEINPSAVSA